MPKGMIGIGGHFMTNKTRFQSALIKSFMGTALFAMAAVAQAEESMDLDQLSLTATAFECGVYGDSFGAVLFDSKGSPSKGLVAFVETKVKRGFDLKKDKGKLGGSKYKSALCELFVINGLGSLDAAEAKDRCEDSRDLLFIEKNMKPTSNSATSAKPNFSLNTFSYGGTANQDSGPDEGEGNCDDDTLASKDKAFQFGCFTQGFRARAKSDKKSMGAVLLLCAQLGVDMNAVSKKALKAVQFVPERPGSRSRHGQ